MLADPHVVRNLDQVVEDAAVADHRVLERAAIDRAVRADLDVVADDDPAELRNLDPAALVRREAEAVGTDDGAGMDQRAFADRAVLVDADVGHQPGIGADAAAPPDHDTRAEHHPLADHRARFDHAAGGDAGPVADPDIVGDARGRIDARGRRIGAQPFGGDPLGEPRIGGIGVGDHQRGAAGRQSVGQLGRDQHRARAGGGSRIAVARGTEKADVTRFGAVQRGQPGDHRRRAVAAHLALQALRECLQAGGGRQRGAHRMPPGCGSGPPFIARQPVLAAGRTSPQVLTSSRTAPESPGR